MEYRINTGTQKTIGLMGIIFGCIMIILSVFAKVHWLAFVVSSFFLLLGIWVLLASGVIVLSESYIKYITRFENYEMLWNDVKTIEIDYNATSIVFQGIEKRLAIPGPANWSGTNKSALDFLEHQAQLLNVPFEQNSSAVFKTSKNTKLKRHSS